MTTIQTGPSGIKTIIDYGGGGFPDWQASQELAISKIVDGFSATLTFGRAPSQGYSFRWKTCEFIVAEDAGTGLGYEAYFLNLSAENNRHQFNVVEPGNTYDIPPLTETTNVRAQGYLDAARTSMVRIVQPAFWLPPGVSTIPGYPAKNRYLVAETMLATNTYIWGLNGNDHIISLDMSMVIPTDPVLQSLVQLSVVPQFWYCPNFNYSVIDPTAGNFPFAVQEWVDFTTGTTRAYSGGVSTTEVLMNKNADDSFACALFYGDGALGNLVSDSVRGYKGLNGSGTYPYTNVYAWCAQSYPLGVPAGTVHIPVAICFGMRSDLIGPTGAIVQAAASLPAASYPIP